MSLRSPILTSIVILLLSGTYAFSSIGFVVAYFFISFLVFYAKKGYRNKGCKSNFKVVGILCFWVVLTTLILRSDVLDKTYMLYILYPIGSLFLITSFDFYILRINLLRCLNYILFISIIVHFLYMFQIIPANFDSDAVKYIVLGIFNVHNGDDAFLELPWGNYYRFSSIYGEPGQLGCVLIFILLLFTDEISKSVLYPRRFLSKFGFIVLSIILSCSTTTYICFAIYLIGLFIFSENVRSNSKLLYFATLIVITVAVYAIFKSDVVVDKFEQRNSIEDTSYSIRMADNLVCLEMTINNPIFGLGRNTAAQKSFFLRKDNRTSSNGWLLASASFGVFYILFIFYRMYKQIYKMNFKTNALFILFVLVFQQCNEAAIFLPYVYLFILRYKSYDRFLQNRNDKLIRNYAYNHSVSSS